MKPEFISNPNPSTEQLRRDVDRAFGRMGEGCRSLTLERVTIGSTETRIRHEGFKRWRSFSPESPSIVYQTRLPDSEFIYLAADPTETVVGLELF